MQKHSARQPELQLTHTPKASGPSGSNKLATFSAKVSAVTAAKMLDFVREMSLGSEEFSQRQADYWIFILQDYPPAQIERAFHQWVKQSKHMPVPSEIIAILEGMAAAERQKFAAQQTQDYVAEMRDTRRQLAAAGEAYGEDQYREVMKKALEAIKKIPAAPDPNRLFSLKERLAKAQKEKSAQRRPSMSVSASPMAAPMLTQDKRQSSAAV